MTVDDFSKVIDTPEMPLVIDVRGDEYAFGHFKGDKVVNVAFKGQEFLPIKGRQAIFDPKFGENDATACTHIAELIQNWGVKDVVFHCLMG